MSNERSSVFETFSVQGDSGDTLDQIFQDPQVIPAPQFYTQQQQSTTYIIHPSPVRQQPMQQKLQTQNAFSIQRQDPMFQQYIAQQQQQSQQQLPSFSSQQQANLLQQQLFQQKQIYQQRRQQQQQLTFNHIEKPNDSDILHIDNNINIPIDNNTLFLNNDNIFNVDLFDNNNDANDTPYLLNNNNNNIITNNTNTTIIDEQPNDDDDEDDVILIQDDNNTNNSVTNNYYDNSCNDFTGVEEVVEELWMSCESHDPPVFNQSPNNEQVYDFVDSAEVSGGKKKDGEKKKKKKRKKNMPSCYSLFYRDTQLAIKEQRPDASLHEVTSIVDSMWKQLEPKHKAYYEKLAEVEKAKHKRLLKKEAGKALKGKEGSTKKNKQSKNLEKPTSHVTCRREGCLLRAIDDSRWNMDYCSTQCVVSHCKDVYKAWVLSRKMEAQKNEKDI